MFRLLLAAFLLMPTLAFAQSQRNPCYINSKGGCTPVGTSGAPNGAQPMPVTASVSASISGFNQESVLTPITATTGGATSSAFTAGKVIVVSNVGSTNTAYCRLGGSSTTSGQPILPGSWFAFTSVLETTVTCATSTSTTTVNVSVGTGLPTGAGGGSSSGGGGGGAVTVADGADVTQGAIADTAATAGGTGTLSAKTRLMTTQLGAINTTLGSPFQAGGSIGNTSFGISGTLPAFGATPTFNLGTLNGAATAANQSTANGSLSSIDGKTPALGQALAAASVPVILPAATITTLTPPTTITANAGTNLNTSALATSANLTSGTQKTQIVDGSGNVIASTSNNLNVQCANCSGSGASGTDQGTFTAGASTFAPGGGFYQTSATSNPLTTGQWGAWQLTANRAGFVNLRNTAGAEIATASIPLRVDPTGSTTQPVSGTVTANATLAAETTKVIGTVRNLGNAGAITDFAGQNASSPANSWLIGGQFNTTPTTITSGNSSPLQLDNAGNLLVNIKAGASSGAVAQGSTTSGQTGGLIQGAVTTSAPTYTTAQTNPLSLDTSGNLRTVVTSAVGLAQGSTTSGQTGSMIMGAVTTSAPTYTTAQTSPLSLDTAGSLRINCATGCSTSSSTAPVSTMNSASANSGVNAANAAVFDDVSPTAITENNFGFLRMSANRNAYTTLRDAAGNERGANVDASNRLTVAPSMVSGSVASGAFASGSIASGALASGSIAAGAQVDLLTMRGTKNAGTAAANSLLAGGVYNSTPLTLTDTQQSSLQLNASGNLRVDNVSVAGTTILTGNGATGSGSQRVTIANDSSAIAVKGEGATGSAAPTGAQQMGVRSGANMVAATQANASVAISGNSAATTQLVALSASAVIHVTSFDFMSAGTANVTLVYGTGTNCGTGTTSLTGAYPLTAQAGISKGSGQGPVLVVPAGNALCWTNSAGVQVSGSLSYTQFVP